LEKKGLIGMVMGIVSIVLVLLAMFSYGYVGGYIEAPIVGKMDVTYGLFGYKIDTPDGEKEFKYNDDEVKDSNVAENAGSARMMLIVGLIMVILFFIFALLAAMGKMGGKIGMIIGIIAGIILLLMGIAAAGALKTGIQDDYQPLGFGYSITNGIMTYMVIIGAILTIVGGVMLKGLGKAPAPAPVPPPPAY
jgi:amino acid transporter